jgi:hypothetical protein
MTTQPTLPPQFDDLRQYLADWNLPTEKERFLKRTSTPLAQVRDFNNAMYARIHDVIAYLDSFPLGSSEPQVVTLMNLARSYMETSHPVDLDWKIPDPPDAFPPERLTFLPPSC